MRMLQIRHLTQWIWNFKSWNQKQRKIETMDFFSFGPYQFHIFIEVIIQTLEGFVEWLKSFCDCNSFQPPMDQMPNAGENAHSKKPEANKSTCATNASGGQSVAKPHCVRRHHPNARPVLLGCARSAFSPPATGVCLNKMSLRLSTLVMN